MHTHPTRRDLLRWGVSTGAALLLAAGHRAVSIAQETATPAATPTAPPVPAELFAAFGLSSTTAEGWPLDVVLATPAFLTLAQRAVEIEALGADTSLVICTTRRHGGGLTGDDAAFTVSVRIDAGDIVMPTAKRLLSDDGAKREDAFIFRDIPPGVTAESHLLEALIPGADPATPVSLPFILPLVAPSAAGTPTPGAERPPPSDADWLETVMPAEEVEVC